MTTPEQLQAWTRKAGVQYAIDEYPALQTKLKRFAELARADLVVENEQHNKRKELHNRYCDTLAAERDALRTEVERLTQQCKLFDAAAYKAQVEAQTLVEAAKVELETLRAEATAWGVSYDNLKADAERYRELIARAVDFGDAEWTFGTDLHGELIAAMEKTK